MALAVPVDRVRAAAGQRQRGTPFVLPARTSGLTQTERQFVLSVINAILGDYREDGDDQPVDEG